LEDNKTIRVVADSRTKGTIVTTISGDTGYDYDLIKTTTYNKTNLNSVCFLKD